MSHLNAICFLGGKSGAGKSYLSLNLAYLMAKRKSQVLLVDLDIFSSGLSDFFTLKQREKSEDWYLASQFLQTLASKNPDLEEFYSILKAASHLAYVYKILDKDVYDSFSFIPCESGKLPFFTGGASLSINFIKFLVSAQKMGYEYVIFDCEPGNHILSLISAIFSNTLVLVSEQDAISVQATNRVKKQIQKETSEVLESLEKRIEKDQGFKILFKDWHRFIRMEKQQQIFIFNRCQKQPEIETKHNQIFVLQESEVAQNYDKGCLAFFDGMIQEQKIAITENISSYVLSILSLYKKIAERYGNFVEDLDLPEASKTCLPSSEEKELENFSEEEHESEVLFRPENQELINEYQILKEKYEELLLRDQSLEQECLKYQEEMEHALHNQKETAQEHEMAQKEYQKLYETHKQLSEKFEKLKKQQETTNPPFHDSISSLEKKDSLEIQKLKEESQKIQEQYLAQTMAYHELEKEYNRLVAELNAWKDKLYEIQQNEGTQKLVKDVLKELEKISTFS